jgi:hypothetical protein
VQNAPMALLWKSLMVLGFPLLLYVSRFFVSGELKMLGRLASAVGVARNGAASQNATDGHVAESNPRRV